MQRIDELSPSELRQILNLIDPYHRGERIQKVRLAKLVAEHPRCQTSTIRAQALIGNISDVAISINDCILHELGIQLCSEIGEVVRDHFGAIHQIYHWSYYRTDPTNFHTEARAETVRGAF